MKRFLLILPPLLAFVCLFFVDWGMGPTSPGFQLNSFAHVGYFALVAWGVALVPQVARRPYLLQVGWILILVLVLGGGIELIQPHFGRNASWDDLTLDLVGGLVGLLYLAPARRRLRLRLLRSGQLAVLALAGTMLYGPTVTLLDMWQASRHFPVLGDFENRLEAGRWSRGEIDRQVARHGERSLRVELGTEKYTGTTLRRSFGDWQGYRTLAFSLYNPDAEPLRIVLSVRDQEHDRHGSSYHDRFNRAFQVKQGWNDFQVRVPEIQAAPAGRSLDLSRLRAVVFFAVNLPEPRVFYLDHLRLLP